MKPTVAFHLWMAIVNFMNYVDADEPIVRLMTKSVLADYQYECKAKLDSLQRIVQEQKPYIKEQDFVYPCDKCKIRKLEYGPIDGEKLNAKNVADDFYSNMTVRFENVIVDCKCHVFDSDVDIEKAYAIFSKENFDPLCTKVDEEHTKKFDANKTKACLHPKSNDPDRKDPRITITLNVTDLDIDLYVREDLQEIDLGRFLLAHRQRTMKGIQYYIIRKEIKEHNPIHVKCGVYDKGDSYEAKSCACLKTSGFFDAFPYLLAEHYFQCGDESRYFTFHVNYYASCRNLFEQEKIENDDED